MERLGFKSLNISNGLNRNIYSVSKLTWLLKQEVEQEFPLVWVKGQISNLSRPSSGHIYFSLTDNESVLPVVWFKSNQFIASQTLLDGLYNGQEIICAGKVTIFSQRGNYQLIAEYVEDIGVGKFYLELEALKKKLEKFGYFDPERKKTIPKNPKRVALITAISGAAIRDFFKIVKEKSIPARFRVYPSTVQGNEAKYHIVQMIELANKHKWADVIVIIRGGGPLEDLCVFNCEEIATAIFNSNIPIVTGIGHEIDYSIADMVADMRLATPTQVAEYLFEDSRYYEQILDEQFLNLRKNIKNIISSKQNIISDLFHRLRRESPIQRFKAVEDLLNQYIKIMMDRIFWKIDSLNNLLKLNFINLFSILKHKILKKNIRELAESRDRLFFNMDRYVNNNIQVVEILENRLKNLDPTFPLKKGYSVVLFKGKEVKDSSQLDIGDDVTILFYRGKAHAKIRNKE